jgi:plastocyanin
MFRRSAAAAAAVIPVLCLLALLLGADAPKDGGGVKKLEIKDKKYAPAKLTIKAGQTVAWINRDDSDHQVTITLDGKSVGSSGDLGRGESFKFKFDKPGKYRFSCKYHPREKGEITVE